MIIGTGVDICNIDRIKNSLNKFGQKFIERICNKEEIKELSCKKDVAKSLAKIFAAKEATSKALGTGIGQEVSFLDINLCHNNKGKPFVTLSQKVVDALQIKDFNIEISISDDEPYAVAFVIIEGIKNV